MPDRMGIAAGPVLVLAPTGRDADGAGLLLGREGIAWQRCPDLGALLAVLEGDGGADAGAVLVADEALARAELEPLAQLLAAQPPWSDLPFVVLTQNGSAARRALAERRLPEVLGNVVFLERPLNALTLLSAVRSALRARTRQRQVAAYLEEREGRAEALRRSEAALRALNETLEARVGERTAELSQALDALHEEALERTRTEEQLHQAQKMEAVGQLTGGIAHDFNNMLQGVAGSLDMVRRRIAQGRAEEVGRYVDAASGAVERAAGLTHRLLAFARRQALAPKHVEPDALVQGMAELIRRTVGPQVELALDLRDGRWSVLCDPNQLESVLLNLAINARDAMPEGGRLRIATRDVRLTEVEMAGQAGAGPGEYVEFLVADTGTGMTPDVLAHAFEPFFTTKPAGQGTGLGLSQIYGFVQQSDGVVRLDSAPGKGTTVRMFLPRFLVEPDAEEDGEAAEQPSAAGGTVLIVEDEAGVRALVAEALQDLGYDVLEAGDAASGLRALRGRDGRIDLLLTDVGLPGLNGRQLADAARELVPALPVLLITGYAGPALQDWQLAPGMEVVAKPFKLDALTARVAGMLGHGAGEGREAGAAAA